MIYEPSEDSFLLQSVIPKYVKGKKCLDMGAGSGILSKTALDSGASSVLAVDVNPEVVQYLKKRSIPALNSDLFQKVSGKFDVIIFNPPYLPKHPKEDSESELITTGGEKGDEIVIRFLHDSLVHLNPKGVILLLVSSLTPKQRILRMLAFQGYKKTPIAKKSLFMEQLEVWKIVKSQ